MPKQKHIDAAVHVCPPDLPGVLRAATDAVQRQSITPTVLQTPPPDAAPEALAAALKPLETAVLYVCVFGEAPSEHELAVAEKAYNRAIERKISFIIMQMGEKLPEGQSASEPPPLPDPNETPEEAASRLEQERLVPFRERLKTGRGIVYFKTAPEMRAFLVNGLSKYHIPEVNIFHYVTDIPKPPADYTAHPYTLLPTGQLAGRKRELDLLTEWVTSTEHEVRVLSVVAIGGMGKSAMTWKWYREIAREVMKPMAGCSWWSFYESDAYFENFVIRTLAYVARADEAEIREITPPERERQLLEILDKEPYLLVLDGIERIMISYARMDAARMDEDDLDEITSNQVAGAIGVPQEAEQSMFSPHRLRKTADPRAGAFLRKLTKVKASRILISSRLYPADLQSIVGYPIQGSHCIFLTGLTDDEAYALWQSYGNSGERDEMVKIFNTFDNYPLIIRALAGEVSRFKPAPCDFAAWRKAHSGFDPLRQTPEQIKAHMMTYAVTGLTDGERQTLNVIASFRMPNYFDALARLLVKQEEATEAPSDGKDATKEKGKEKGKPQEKTGLMALVKNTLSRGASKPTKFTSFEDEAGLDAALAELEGRGLMGWDRRANRYDLHPIVRNVVWNSLDKRARKGLYSKLNAHFGSLSPVSADDIKSIDQLTGVIELYNTLIGLERYDEAFAIYTERLHQPMLRRLAANRQIVELMEALFPDGLQVLPRQQRQSSKALVMNTLAVAYQQTGEPSKAGAMYFRATELAENDNIIENVSIGLCNLSDALRHSGNLRAAETAANRALLIEQAVVNRPGEALALILVGLSRLVCGNVKESDMAFQRSLRILKAINNRQLQGVVHCWLAQQALYMGDPATARNHADMAYELADHAKYEADYVRALRYQGAAALEMGNLEEADELLLLALTRARAASLVEHELFSLIRLAELRRRQGDFKASRDLLEDVWEPADRGPYRLLHGDAYNVNARLEHDLNLPESVTMVATTAFYLGWCDGEPYAYQWGLDEARRHLKQYNAPFPDDLLPYDEKRYGPYLGCVIDPNDEFNANAPVKRPQEPQEAQK